MFERDSGLVGILLDKTLTMKDNIKEITLRSPVYQVVVLGNVERKSIAHPPTHAAHRRLRLCITEGESSQMRSNEARQETQQGIPR